MHSISSGEHSYFFITNAINKKKSSIHDKNSLNISEMTHLHTTHFPIVFRSCAYLSKSHICVCE